MLWQYMPGQHHPANALIAILFNMRYNIWKHTGEHAMNKPKMITAKFATPKDVARRHAQFLAERINHCAECDPSGYICTLDAKHKGDHIAYDTRHNVCAQWAQK
jgi:hypothetical protein